MANKAKDQAVADIMQDLQKQGKSFIAFRKDLNPVMGHIVKNYSELQKAKRK